jgi:hypothetical protein
MAMQARSPAAPLLVLAGLAASCAADRDAAPEAAGLAIEARRQEWTAGECGAAEDSPCARFSAEVPEIVAAPEGVARQALNDAFRAMLRAGREARAPVDLEAQARSLLAAWEQAHARFPGAATVRQWQVEKRMIVLHRDARLLSVRLDETSYTGGAHPNSLADLATFDLASGRRITLDDVLLPDALPQLTGAAGSAFRETRAVPADRSLREAGFWFEGDVFSLPDRWAIVGEGLAFHFDAYEVAPYAAGPTDFVVPWSALRGALKPDYLGRG